MFEDTGTATGFFNNAHKLIEAYHTVLLPLCRDTGLPPLALDILLYLANHPQQNMARDICRCRGLKPGIVSVHVDRLVREGLLRRSGTGRPPQNAAFVHRSGSAYYRTGPNPSKASGRNAANRPDRLRNRGIPALSEPVESEY